MILQAFLNLTSSFADESKSIRTPCRNLGNNERYKENMKYSGRLIFQLPVAMVGN